MYTFITTQWKGNAYNFINDWEFSPAFSVFSADVSTPCWLASIQRDMRKNHLRPITCGKYFGFIWHRFFSLACRQSQIQKKNPSGNFRLYGGIVRVSISLSCLQLSPSRVFPKHIALFLLHSSRLRSHLSVSFHVSYALIPSFPTQPYWRWTHGFGWELFEFKTSSGKKNSHEWVLTHQHWTY